MILLNAGLILGILASQLTQNERDIRFFIILIIILTPILYLGSNQNIRHFSLKIFLSALLGYGQGQLLPPQPGQKTAHEEQKITWVKGYLNSIPSASSPSYSRLMSDYAQKNGTWKKQETIYYLKKIPDSLISDFGRYGDYLVEVKPSNWSSLIAFQAQEPPLLHYKSLQVILQKRIQPYLSAGSLGLLAPLCWGGSTAESPKIKGIYKKVGLAHVLAVSGMHVGLLFGLLFFLFRITLKRKRQLWWKMSLVATALLAFTFLTGGRPSVLRATGMAFLFLLSIKWRKNYRLINALLWTTFFLLAFQPQLLFSLSFQLSSLAVLGIANWYSPIMNLIPKFRGKSVLSVFVIGLCAQMLTFPLLIFHFEGISKVGFFTNYLATLSIPLFFIGGWLMQVLTFFPPAAEIFGEWFSLLIEKHNLLLAQIAAWPNSYQAQLSFPLWLIPCYWVFIISLSSFWQYRLKKMLWLAGISFIIGNGVYYIHQWEKETSSTEERIIMLQELAEN